MIWLATQHPNDIHRDLIRANLSSKPYIRSCVLPFYLERLLSDIGDFLINGLAGNKC
jgi:hypothetical protein